MRSKAFYKRGLKSARHADIKLGDVVYFDNFQDGKFRFASPLISGPFTKVIGNGSGRSFGTRLGQNFMYYPENILVPILTPDESRARYLKIVKRLKKRFSFRGSITVSIAGKDSPFTRLEKMAYAKYILTLPTTTN